jgi:predicted GH43/DUF377 family glycosyl hydrolase
MQSQKKQEWLSISAIGKEIFLFYKKNNKKGEPVRILKSADGLNFEPSGKKVVFKNKFLGLGANLDTDGRFMFSRISDGQFISYRKKIRKDAFKSLTALSQNGIQWEKLGLFGNEDECGVMIETASEEEKYLMFFGERLIKVATSPDLKKWSIKRSAFLHPRKWHFDSRFVSVGSLLYLEEGNLIIYLTKNRQDRLCLGAVLLDRKNWQRVLWRSTNPIWEQPVSWKSEEVAYVGSTYRRGKFLVYWNIDGELRAMSIAKDGILVARKKVITSNKKISIKNKKIPVVEKHLKLTKHESNPVLKPNQENKWESHETFNPAAVHLDEKVHLLYRAIGESGLSVLGYASSKDGVRIDERLNKPVYTPIEPFEYSGGKKPTFHYPYCSGGGWGGCEDPRLSRVDDRIYMTYVAFNGCHPPGVALTSISVKDFSAKKWNWKVPRLISKKGEIQKNWVVFPEKIRGKYAILHSISPSILIDYFENLDKKKIVIESYHNNKSDDTRWDNILRGVGAPPLKTEYGWLVFYHAMDKRDPNRYKVGAMLLDYHNPEVVLHRSPEPILEPIERYENEGSKFGVVYVCGSVIKDDQLFVYYGGADKFSCVATAPLKKFLDSLIDSSKPTPLLKVVTGK